MSLLHKFFLLYFLPLLIVQAKPLKIIPFNPFFDDGIGCENFQYPSEILAPVPYLKECLSTTDVLAVFPGDPDYYNSIKVANCRNNYFPVVVIYATTISDIQKSIHCANTLNISATARSGGHSFEEYGNGGKNGVMVIDVQEFKHIDINFETKTAIIGVGNRLGEIYHKLNKFGYLISAGECINVGLGGHATGGVTNGTFISPINLTHHSDLFFAIRGAGNAGYGIITSLTLKIYPVQPIITSIKISYFPEQVELAFITFAKVAKNFNENLSGYMELRSKNSNPYTFTFIATYLGIEEEARSAVKELIELSNPAYIKFEEMTWLGIVDSYPPFTRQPFKITSYTIPPSGFSQEAIRALVNIVDDAECEAIALFDLYASEAVSSISINSTAFIHRNIFGVLELELPLKGYSKDDQIKCVEKHLQFRQEFQAKYTSYFSYQDYIDKDLPDWLTRYYGPHVTRLIEIKKKYDPNNFFNWKQSIPTKLP
ncbi:10374_t:CDS:2 [Gigaspora margarita]|uniref:10374_t:CDS:1 n=1 Tax=Gigaspora margarita TaxID=4874 RepID=A0ABN7UAZ8_GIGMA|nr:10374_t:CDS:2 [Gigaspora margarita]